MIVIASDHGGLELKGQLVERFGQEGIGCCDIGVHSKESVDYPDIAAAAVRAMREQEAEFAIVICGTGIGISVSANKHSGIICALCSDSYSARMAREHNNANMLALGGRVIGAELAWDIVTAFRTSKFQGGRHSRRVEKILAQQPQLLPPKAGLTDC